MYGTKLDIDKYFNDNWHSTPIQFDGAKFIQPLNGRWVSINILPRTRAYLGRCIESQTTIQVSIFETSVTEAYKLADDVIDFLELKTAGKTSIETGHSDGFGADDLGGIFRIGIEFESYRYTTKHTPTHKDIVVNHGIPVIDHGLQVIN